MRRRQRITDRQRADSAKRAWLRAIGELPPQLTPRQATLLGQHSAVSYDSRNNLILAPQSSRIRDEAHRLGLYHRIGGYLRGARLAEGAVLDDALLPPALRGGPSLPILPDASDQIAGEALGIGLIAPSQCNAIGFLHAVFAQLGLPRSKPKNPDGTAADRFERRSGRVSLLVTAGELDTGKRFVPQQLPYGSKPRLMMADICTESVRGRSREVDLCESVREYLTKRLGVGWSAGAKGQYTLFRKQALWLASCRMQLGVDYGDRVLHYKGEPIREFQAWVTGSEGQRALWPGTLKLDQDFFDTLMEFGMPIDRRAYRALSRSPLTMDAYTWLAHRMWRIDGSVDITWQALHRDFGQEYKRLRDFRRRFTKALKVAQGVYPQAVDRIHSIKGGIRLYTAKPPVPRGGLKRS